jgi:kynurenine formamidase
MTMSKEQNTPEKRAVFDFEVDFSNGGGIQGQGFRLDIEGDAVSDEALAGYIVRDLRLLMVGEVRIFNKRIVAEPHKRVPAPTEPLSAEDEATNALGGSDTPPSEGRNFVDLSHTVEDGMVTYKGLPAPVICDYLSRVESRKHYAEGTEFQIGQVEMVANTGTYLDSPFHRFADGADVAELDLASLAELQAVVVRVKGMRGRAIERDPIVAALAEVDLRGKAVLVHTGWDAHWRTERYFEGHPFLTAHAARYLAGSGAALVGIDSLNIDDTDDGERPAHTALLGAGIPIVEHLTRLGLLPLIGFRFSAVPVKVKGMGTFPVRAYASMG